MDLVNAIFSSASWAELEALWTAIYNSTIFLIVGPFVVLDLIFLVAEALLRRRSDIR